MCSQRLGRADLERLIAENGGLDGLDLSDSDFAGADLSNLDLRSKSIGASPRFRNVSFIDADLSRCRFHGCDLSGSRFYRANLADSELSVVDLSGADLTRANLAGADLYLSRLTGAILHKCDLHNTDFHQTLLSGAFISDLASIGDKLLQEDEAAYQNQLRKYWSELGEGWLKRSLESRYRRAGEIYRALEQCFSASGNYRASSICYRRARRMEKRFSRQEAANAFRTHEYLDSVRHGLSWLGDWVVELLCDYGESVWRVVIWILLLAMVIGPMAIWLAGGLDWTGGSATAYFRISSPIERALYGYLQYIQYMLDAFTTAGLSELRPKTEAVRFLSGILTFVGVFLVGLLGFVAGNRIRHT